MTYWLYCTSALTWTRYCKLGSTQNLDYRDAHAHAHSSSFSPPGLPAPKILGDWLSINALSLIVKGTFWNFELIHKVQIVTSNSKTLMNQTCWQKITGCLNHMVNGLHKHFSKYRTLQQITPWTWHQCFMHVVECCHVLICLKQTCPHNVRSISCLHYNVKNIIVILHKQ